MKKGRLAQPQKLKNLENMASRRKEFFPEVTDEQWNDWHWQVQNRIETLDQLKKYIKLTAEEEEGVRKSLETLRMAITPYYLSLIDPENPYCPIRKQSVPTIEELHRSPADLEDPLHEDGDSPAPGLTHRYPDRVLFLITDMCSMYCRHCTRRRFAGHRDCAAPKEQIDKCIEYIERTPEVRDVLLSGGDALLVSDERLEYIIKRLRAIPHVEIRYPFGEPIGVAAWHQRLYACDEEAGTRVGSHPCAPVLHLYLRFVGGYRAFPYAGV